MSVLCEGAWRIIMKMSVGGFYLSVLIGAILLGGELSLAADGDENPPQDGALIFADMVSGSDSQVRTDVELYFDSRKKYFRKYKKRLRDKWIKKASGVSFELVLNGALAQAGKSVHSGRGTRAAVVLEKLNAASAGELEKSACYTELMSAYEEAGGYGAIHNVLRSARIAPMPFDCIESAGYKLANITDSDDNTYNFLLLAIDQANDVLQQAQSANIKFELVERP